MRLKCNQLASLLMIVLRVFCNLMRKEKGFLSNRHITDEHKKTPKEKCVLEIDFHSELHHRDAA